MSSSSVATSSGGARRRSSAREDAGRGPGELAPGAWYGLVAVALAAVFALSVVLTVNGGLRWDDFGNLRFSRETGALDYLLTPVFDHFAPGHRALSLLQYALGPANTVAMHLVMSGIQALALAGFVATAGRLYGRRMWIPVLTVLVSVSTVFVDIQLWFAASLHQVPALAAGLWALYFFLRYRQDDSSRSLPVSVALVVIGLTFISKVLLIIGVIYLVDQLLLRPTTKVREVVGRTLDEWPLWLAYVLPVAVYLVFASDFVTPTQGTSRAGSIVAGLREGWLERFTPLLFGWDATVAESDRATHLALLMLVQALVAGAIYLTARRRRDSLRVVAIVLTVVVVNAVMTLVLRIDAFGSQVAVFHRYWLEPIVLAALLLPWGFVQPPDPDAPPRLQRPPRLLRGTVTGSLFLVVVGVLSTWSAWHLVDDHPAYRARAWLEDVRAAVDSADGRPSIVDDVTPVAWTPIWTLSDFSYLIPDARFLDDPDGQMIAGDRLVDPQYEPFFELDGAEMPSNSLIQIDGDVSVEGTALCATSETDVELLVQESEVRRFGQATFHGSGTVLFVPRTEVGEERPSRQLYEGDDDTSTVFFPAELWSWSSFIVRMLPTDGEPVCLDDLSIGVVENAPPLPE